MQKFSVWQQKHTTLQKAHKQANLSTEPNFFLKHWIEGAPKAEPCLSASSLAVRELSGDTENLDSNSPPCSVPRMKS